MQHARMILDGQRGWTKPLGRHRRRCKNNIKLILNKHNVKVRNEFICLRLESSDGLL
jgi:hypothetical protein